MHTTLAYPHILKPDDAPARLARTPRVRVALVVEAYFHLGSSVEALVAAYAYLSRAEAHAAMLYYWDHQGEIDAEIAEDAAMAARWAEEQRNAPPSSIERILLARRGE